MPKLSDVAFCKALYKKFQDEALPADDARYEPVYEEHPDLKNYDHATLIARQIEFAEIESLTLLSGFRGSGKSTELNRLAGRLREKGYLVLQQDALNYLNPGEEIDIVTLLNALAGAFSDALAESDIGNALKQSYWQRLRTYLTKTDISLSEIGIKANTPAKEAEASLKLAFQTAPTFRQELRAKLQVRLGGLQEQVNQFVEDCRKLVKKKRGAESQIVFIFDQAIYTVRSSYLPIAVEDARALQRVAELRAAAHETSSDKDVRRLAQFMNTHMVLYFINGDEWYDLHPLIRDEVAEIVKRADILDRKENRAAARAEAAESS